MRALITILDNITETSMPYNEFVLYRANHYPDEKQFLIICNTKENVFVADLPENVEIFYSGRNLFRIRKTLDSVVGKCIKQNMPFIIHTHQVQSGFLASISMLGTGLRKKVLFTVHSTFSGYKFHNKMLSFVNACLAQRITCVSNTSYRDYPRLIKWIKGKRIQPLQNGVDIERINKRVFFNNTCGNGDSVVFIYVARLIPIKNHMFLVDVLKKCNSNIRFIFVGAEDKEMKIRSRCEEIGISDRVTFTGLIPRDAVFNELRNADFYISSSTLEGLPVSVLEAMYCGLPCVLSDIPQHREVAGDTTTVLALDVDKWVDELNRLANLSQEQREYLSKQTTAYVEEKFSLEKMHDQYNAIYELL